MITTIEQQVEAYLLGLFRAAIALNAELAELDPQCIGSWNLDADLNGDKPRKEFPLIMVTTSPAGRPRYRSAVRTVQASVTIGTNPGDDPLQATLKALYAVVRASLDGLDTASLTNANIDGMAISGGSRGMSAALGQYLTIDGVIGATLTA